MTSAHIRKNSRTLASPAGARQSARDGSCYLSIDRYHRPMARVPRPRDYFCVRYFASWKRDAYRVQLLTMELQCSVHQETGMSQEAPTASKSQTSRRRLLDTLEQRLASSPRQGKRRWLSR